MNLHFLAQKRDGNLVVSDRATLAVRKIGADTWRGFAMAADPDPQLRIRRATQWSPIRERPESVGWFAAALRGKGKLTLAFTEPDGSTPVRSPLTIDLAEGELAPVRLPWSISGTAHPGPHDLLINAGSKGGDVFLAVHRALDRAPLIKLCTGRGLELGPGPKPQVLPGPGVEVSYIEQMPPDEWRKLYAGKTHEVDDRLWDHYRVGDAHELPVEDGSLDFIFSSHVFEHLANPLRHLEIWAGKLKPGGRIVGVIPDFAGSKDYAAEPSDLRDLIAEYESGEMAPNRAHYARYAAIRGVKDGGAAMFADRRSIHVHYYSHANMARLLEEAKARFGYRDFSLIHTPNHKDFHFVLIK
jgi:SAM-dependent methyltransferase